MSDYHGSVSDEDCRRGKERRKRASAKINKQCRVRPDHLPTNESHGVSAIVPPCPNCLRATHLSQPASQPATPRLSYTAPAPAVPHLSSRDLFD